MTIRILLLWSLSATTAADAQIRLDAPADEFRGRRQRAMAAHPDGLIVFQARTEPKSYEQHAFLQNSNFYYFTGLARGLGAIVVIDGPAKESWLFVPPDLTTRSYFKPYALIPISPETEKILGIEHVEDWSEFGKFVENRLSSDSNLVIYTERRDAPEPGPPDFEIPMDRWEQALRSRFPKAVIREARAAIALRQIKSRLEVEALRKVARLSVDALVSAVRAVAPGQDTRVIEGEAVRQCLQNGGNGIYFWPAIAAGELSPYERFRSSFLDYANFRHVVRSGEVVRIDVGCDFKHYKGDAGRTVPASGRFSDSQREVHDLLNAGYLAGLASMKDGVKLARVKEAFKAAVAARRPSLETELGREAANLVLTDNSNVRLVIHMQGLGGSEGAFDQLRAGMVVAWEPMLTVGGQGFYLEDMVLITASGHEVLTAGLPYAANEIEKMMRRSK